MDPTTAAVFNKLSEQMVADSQQAVARQRDNAIAVLTTIQAGFFRLVSQASDPSAFADLSTASHVPYGQGFPAPGAAPPGTKTA